MPREASTQYALPSIEERSPAWSCTPGFSLSEGVGFGRRSRFQIITPLPIKSRCEGTAEYLRRSEYDIDPKECSENAKRCVELAAKATDPVVQRRLLETAKGWMRLAFDLAKLKKDKLVA